MPAIYGAYRSRATRNFWLANEIGLDLQLRPVLQAYRLADPLAADAPLNTLSPEFLKISPAGAIPVLEDDGFVLSESLAINMYLARKYGGNFGPASAEEDALMLQWSLYAATSVESSALAVVNVHGAGRAATEEGRAEIAALAQKLARPLKVIETHLAAHPWLVGGRMSVADINVAEILRYAEADPAILAPCPAIRAWLDTLHARPAFQRMWTARTTEPA